MRQGRMFYTQTFEPDNDQAWNLMEQPYMPIGRVSASESSSLIQHVDNTSVHGGQLTLQWNPDPRFNGYSSTTLNGGIAQYPPHAPSSSCDPLLHQSAAGNFPFPHDDFSHHSSSDNISVQTAPGDDGAFFHQTMGSGNGRYKRKNPGYPPVCDRGSTSRYYDVGSSSCVPLHNELWEETQKAEPYNTSSGHPPTYRASSLSIGNEGVLRNVRGRAEDIEAVSSRGRSSYSSMSSYFPSRTFDPSNFVDAQGQNSIGSTGEWSHNSMLPPVHRVTYESLPPVHRVTYESLPPVHRVTYESDSSYCSHDPESVSIPNKYHHGSMQLGSNSVDISPNINPMPQNVNSNLSHSIRGFQSDYGHRSVQSFRSSSSNFRPGYAAAVDEGSHVVAESYSIGYRRAFPPIRICNMERSGRMSMSSERNRLPTERAGFHQLRPEVPMVYDHHAEYSESRHLLDMHRDMRLDIENMSYEELLALGERIGSVSTGLSDDSISRCLTASIYCSSDILQDEETCVICLDVYKHMDDVGSLKACGHDFHVGCIRKWLSIKNLCPICKATALDDSSKDK